MTFEVHAPEHGPTSNKIASAIVFAVALAAMIFCGTTSAIAQEKVPFVAVVKSDKSKDVVKEALVRENITWRSFWNGGSTSGPISQLYGVRSWPTIYILDQNGVIRAKNVRGAAMDTVVDELVAAAEAGAMILPAMPAFYQKPHTIDDLADFIAGKILTGLGFDQDLFAPWKGDE